MKKIIFRFIFFLVLYLTFNIDYSFTQWIQVSGGLGNNENVYGLVSKGTDIYAGTNGVYITANNGSNWTSLNLSSQIVVSILLKDSYIFAGTWYNGVFKTTNNGVNWVSTPLSYSKINSIIIKDSTIFAGVIPSGSLTGVMISTNNGTSWATTPINRTVNSLVYNGSYVIAGTDVYGAYYTLNNGTNWVWSDLQFGHTVFALASAGSNIYAGTDSGVYISQNYGATWAHAGLNNKYVHCITVSGNYIFAGCDTNNSIGGGGIYMSTNYGQSWFVKNQGFSTVPRYINSLVVANNYLFASTEHYYVWRRSLSEIVKSTDKSQEIPDRFVLRQNYPNPFNSMTNVKFQMSNKGLAIIKVFDAIGREVATLVNEVLEAGVYQVRFDGGNLESGIYFYQLVVNPDKENRDKKSAQIAVKKMLLIK